MYNNIIKVYIKIGITVMIWFLSEFIYTQHTSVSNFSGNFNVTPVGAAVYSIPIESPVGMGGIQVPLTIVYNSQSSNGLLGVGFELSGLSQITRAPQNMFYDNVISLVDFNDLNFNDNAAFTLDGNRLIKVGYNKYRTSTETFSDILFVDNYWQVHTKDGKTLVYAFPTRVGTADLNWRLTKMIDANGNAIKYNYTLINSGESLLTGIEYTENITQNILPNSKIVFAYEDRPDVIQDIFPGFISESIADGVRQTKRLKKITTYQNETIQKTYVFTYINEYENGNSKLLKIQVFSNGKELTPILFEWGKKDDWQIYYLKDIIIDKSDKKQILTGDFNGDSKSDLLVLSRKNRSENAKWEKADVYFSVSKEKGQVCFVLNKSIDLSNNKITPIIIDVDYDGDEEIILRGYNNLPIGYYYENKTMVMKSLPAEFVNNFQENNKEADFYLTGDFNADGRPDLLTVKKESKKLINDKEYKVSNFWECLFSGCEYNTIKGIDFPDHNFNIVTTSREINNFSLIKGNGISSVVPIDFNGDGKSDIFFARNTLEINSPCRSTGKNFSINSIAAIPFDICDKGEIKTKVYYHMDINTLNLEGINIKNGINTLFSLTDLEHNFKSEEFNFGDFNGDGKTDLLFSDIGKILYSNGKNYTLEKNIESIKTNKKVYGIWSENIRMNSEIGYITESCDVTSDANNTTDDLLIADFNGDGKSDILKVKNFFLIDRLSFFCTIHTKKYHELEIIYSKTTGSFSQPQRLGSFYAPNGKDDIAIGDFNGDGKMDIYVLNDQMVLSSNDNEYKVLSIKDGFNNKIDINYASINQSESNYKPYKDGAYPITDIVMPFKVVKKVNTYNAKQENIGIDSYDYEGLKLHRFGKGLLGFMKFIVYNEKDNSRIETQFEIDPEFVNFNVKQTLAFKDGKLLVKETFTNSVKKFTGKLFAPFVSQKIVENFSENLKTIENYTYDDALNPINIEATYFDITTNQPLNIGYNKQQYSYTNKASFSNIPNKVLSSISETKVKNQFPTTEEIFFEYDDKGNLFRKYDLIDTVRKLYDISFYYNAPSGMMDSAKNLISTLLAYGPVFYNDETISGELTKNDCGEDYLPSKGRYIVHARKYISYSSFEAAKNLALKDIADNAQTYVNRTGVCEKLYFNKTISKNYRKNDCSPGYQGSDYVYTLEAKKLYSKISEEHLQQMLENKFLSEGQKLANEKGTCDLIYYSRAMDSTFDKGCGSDSLSRPYAYHINAGKDSSTVSQTEADSLARYKFIIEGEREADLNSVCLKAYKSRRVDTLLKSEKCDEEHRPRDFNYILKYAEFKDTLSQHYVDSLALGKVKTIGQQNANDNGVCVKLVTYNTSEARIIINTCTENNSRLSTILNSKDEYEIVDNPVCKEIEKSEEILQPIDY